MAAGLAKARAGRVAVIEAGPSDAHPLVKMPFGLVWLMGSHRRDWRYLSAPLAGANGRQIAIPRGRMLGGSGSINSMVWFRGRADDFDGWGLADWTWDKVAPEFDEIEAVMAPAPLSSPHPLTRALARLFGSNDQTPPTPERTSAGVCHFNIKNGARWSAADGFLRPARRLGITVFTGSQVVRLIVEDGHATGVHLADGRQLSAIKGIVLSAGSIGSPELLLRSGIGPAADLHAAGIPVVLDAPEVGANLHDHPGVGLHFEGADTGYGLTPGQAWTWISAPFQFLLRRQGVFASPTVEGSAFFNAANDGGAPDVQSHFIPFFLNWRGNRFGFGSGYFADVCLCRPRSRGRLRLTGAGLQIDLGILTDARDVATMVAGVKRLRAILAAAPFPGRPAQEVFPGTAVQSDAEIEAHIRANAATAYHPVGTLRMGESPAPVTPKLALRGVKNLWVADASVMPRVTSANTNAPTIMIGHRAAKFIAKDAA